MASAGRTWPLKPSFHLFTARGAQGPVTSVSSEETSLTLPAFPFLPQPVAAFGRENTRASSGGTAPHPAEAAGEGAVCGAPAREEAVYCRPPPVCSGFFSWKSAGG